MTYIRQIDGNWYAFWGDEERNQVYGIGNDCPSQAGCLWVSRWNDSGIKYVASASPSRNAAYQKARRHGKYNGEG